MPINPNIALQVGQGVTPTRSPADIYGKILGIQGQRQEQELNQQSIEANKLTMERNARNEEAKAAQAQRDADEDAVIQQGLIDNKGDLNKTWETVYTKVRPAKALEFKKSIDEGRKAAAAIAKDELPVAQYRDERIFGLIAKAKALTPEQYAAQYPQIAAEYEAISGEPLTEQIPYEQLPWHEARVVTRMGLLDEQAKKIGITKAEQDAIKAKSDANVAVATEPGRIAAGPDATTGLTPNETARLEQQRLADAALAADRQADNIRQNAQLAIAQQNLKLAQQKAGGDRQESSALADVVIKNPELYDQLTPTEKGRIAPVLDEKGFSGFGKPMSETAIKQVSSADSALGALDSLEAYLMEHKEDLGPISGLAALNPYSSAKEVQAKLKLEAQKIGKQLEGGVLRKEDERKYAEILSKITDTPETALFKLREVRQGIERDKAEFVKQQRFAGKRVDSSEGKFSIPTITDESGYNKLKSGDKFIWNGREGTKP
jgi:hypothetical protein